MAIPFRGRGIRSEVRHEPPHAVRNGSCPRAIRRSGSIGILQVWVLAEGVAGTPSKRPVCVLRRVLTVVPKCEVVVGPNGAVNAVHRKRVDGIPGALFGATGGYQVVFFPHFIGGVKQDLGAKCIRLLFIVNPIVPTGVVSNVNGCVVGTPNVVLNLDAVPSVTDDEIVLHDRLGAIRVLQAGLAPIEGIEDDPIAAPRLDAPAICRLKVTPDDVVGHIYVGSRIPIVLDGFINADPVIALLASLDGIIGNVADDREVIHTDLA